MQHKISLAIQLQEQLENILHYKPATMRALVKRNKPPLQSLNRVIPPLYRKEEAACDSATD